MEPKFKTCTSKAGWSKATDSICFGPYNLEIVSTVGSLDCWQNAEAVIVTSGAEPAPAKAFLISGTRGSGSGSFTDLGPFGTPRIPLDCKWSIGVL